MGVRASASPKAVVRILCSPVLLPSRDEPGFSILLNMLDWGQRECEMVKREGDSRVLVSEQGHTPSRDA